MSRKRILLLTATLMLAAAIPLVWLADDARGFQNYYLTGPCWPASVEADGTMVPVEDFMRDRVARSDLNAVERFLHTRMHHRILLYLLVGCALLGWAGWILLRILSAEGEGDARRPLPSWESLFASLLLSAMAGGILFLLLMGSKAAAGSEAILCISHTEVYFVAAVAVGAGLFVVIFFKWFERRFQDGLKGLFR